MQWEEAQDEVWALHGRDAYCLPGGSWSDEVQFARTHEMNMDIATMNLLGLHESVSKKDIYQTHLGWRAKLFVPKKVRKKDKAKAAKDHIFH